MKDYENPMLRPMTDQEEWEQLSEDDIKELPKCIECDEPVMRRYKKMNIHKTCYEIGKAEYMRAE